METKYHIRLLFAFVGLCIYITASAQRNIYISLNNTKEVNVPQENYISSLDAGAVFGKGPYFFAGGGLSIMKVWGPEYSSIGLGLGPDVQINVLKRAKFKLFLEGKGRVMYLFPEYPNNALNYAFWGGPSIEFFLSRQCNLKLGPCYNHLSNAKSHEQNYNRSLDGLGINIGFTFY
ncbi:MAG: hypothetical protein V4580_09390 [Bacteroidota bacterium]